MNLAYLIPAIVVGGLIAWLLNKLLASKIENKGYRIGLNVVSYIVCIVLGITFAVIGSLRVVLDTFATNRMEFMERKLVETFPNSDIMGKNIDTSELASIVDELKQTMNGVNTSGDSYLESLIYDAFTNKLSAYVQAAESGVNTIASARDENGMVTVKSVLYNVKDTALDTVEPYFKFGQIAILILLVIFIGIYAGVAAYLKKGGAKYNKSIVFGEADEPDTFSSGGGKE
jgi:hypothetical protein